MHTKLVIVAGIRTPFTRMSTDLAHLTASDLGKQAVSSLLAHTSLDPKQIDEVIMGCVGQPADSANIARIIALRSGIPERVPASTVNRNCASGIESILSAHQKLMAGMGECFIVGGCESMSNYPLIYRNSAIEHFTELAQARSLKDRLIALSHFRPHDFSPLLGLQLGLSDPVSGLNMGETAEVLARDFELSREEQDAFALRSHERAIAAQAETEQEIAPIYTDERAVLSDNGLRPDSSLEKLGKLQTLFDKKTGSVTAGNASQITDGAVALLVTSEAKARELGIEPLGYLKGYAVTGCDPKRMGIGPVQAIAAANKKTGQELSDADVIEINEAFAAQVLAVLKALKDPKYAVKAGLEAPLGEISAEQLNPRGGAIALGHPVGATGARLVLSALKQLQASDRKRALVSVCVGGGQGTALWLER